jgi:CTP synthase
MRLEQRRDTLFIHLTYVPFLKAAREIKTKPTQHSVKELREIGIQPDLLVCRSEAPLSAAIREKIGLFCNVAREGVIEALDVNSIYRVPLMLHESGLDAQVVQMLDLKCGEADISAWREMVEKIENAPDEVRIAVVGKYTHVRDAYKSIIEALTHGGVANDCRVNLDWVDSEDVVSRGAEELLRKADACSSRRLRRAGIEGKIAAARFARENDLPYFGICLGMQVAAIEFARNVCGLAAAHSSEFEKGTPHPVIDLMAEQLGKTQKGGTMRLGSFECFVPPHTHAHEAYGTELVHERHRHRYEFNNAYRELFERAGLRVAGVHRGLNLVEILELEHHPWFVGVQFHPELGSRPAHRTRSSSPSARPLARHRRGRNGSSSSAALWRAGWAPADGTRAEAEASGRVGSPDAGEAPPRFGGKRLAVIAGPCVLESADLGCASPSTCGCLPAAEPAVVFKASTPRPIDLRWSRIAGRGRGGAGRPGPHPA